MAKLVTELVGDVGGLFLRSLGGGCHERSPYDDDDVVDIIDDLDSDG